MICYSQANNNPKNESENFLLYWNGFYEDWFWRTDTQSKPQILHTQKVMEVIC